MPCLKITKKQRLVATIAISASFFVAELAVGFQTKSLALVADAFHYLTDLIGFLAALIAVIVSEREKAPQSLPFGWKRAEVLGAFFNGVFLLALGLSILLQAAERFAHLEHVENPVLILIMGCIGLGLNMVVMSFLHETHHHGHNTDHTQTIDVEKQTSTIDTTTATTATTATTTTTTTTSSSSPDSGPAATNPHPHHHTDRDLGMLGVLIHVIGDAINNAGVIVAAVVIWKGTGEGRFYADPGVGLFIAVTIMLSAWPLCKRAGYILLESAPPGLDLERVRTEAVQVSGVQGLERLRVWRVGQGAAVATAQVQVDNDSVCDFERRSESIAAYLKLHGIEAIALQPVSPQARELAGPRGGIPVE
ncbi:cation diffusion facilitator family transporter [Colletotrichum kahawae]|uniref:Cation diffusion facilitator family transporter n=1 Tax=Colletotrichum kahawae TaxID=34407 RepID=A0AAE0DA92_COLKA|nr:cation diffusion facilitator family transporter [Colletotrichum kahawae]